MFFSFEKSILLIFPIVPGEDNLRITFRTLSEGHMNSHLIVLVRGNIFTLNPFMVIHHSLYE